MPHKTQPSVNPGEASHTSTINGSRRRNSFFLHLRPPRYDVASSGFSATWYLGTLAMFFVAVELVTGLVLMVYYTPTIDAAYESIVRLESDVAFGWLARDLHRLGGEVMIVVLLLHMARVFLQGRFRGEYRLTWITGVFLLLLTLLLAFTGYLLSWDQLAYWAVTIGCGLAGTIPVIGDEVALLLKGGAQFGQDGLLRFYLLHVLLIPIILALFLAVHYFRIARIHVRRSKQSAPGNVAGNGARVPLLPDIALRELLLVLLSSLVLVAIVSFFYDAPLQNHADPRHTPAGPRAPWFFLWFQGALKLGSSLRMGIYFPLVLLVLLLGLPLLPRIIPGAKNEGKISILRSIVLAILATGFGVLSFAGLPRYGIEMNPATPFFESLAPNDGDSSFHAIPFTDLQVGIYSSGTTGSPWPEQLYRIRDLYQKGTSSPEASGICNDCEAILIIEDWQTDVKRITVRLTDQYKAALAAPHSLDRVIFVHKNHTKQ